MILVFGENGQVALELARALRAQEAVFAGRARCDLTVPEQAAELILALKPRAVINAAAYTAVDRAETEEDLASAVNGAAPAAMARAAAQLGVPFVHLSTDYVFDGAGELPFAPEHKTAPLNAYGRSKLLGEQGVMAAGGKAVILRTSWVFSAHGNNFVKTMLRLGRERDRLTVVADQIGGPTPAAAIAQACLAAVARLEAEDCGGIYHFAGAPAVSWAEFARAVMQGAGLACEIADIPSSAYPTPAARPANSRMDCTSLARLGLAAPDWRAGLADVLRELEA